MIKIIYLLGMFWGSLTLVYATEVLDESSTNSETVFAAEWIGLIVLALIGFVFIYRSSRQLRKIKALQKKLDTYQTDVSHELDTIGGKDA